MKVSHTLLITNISNVIVVNLFNILFLAGKQKSSDKSNQTRHALSACDKFSQRVTAHAAVTDVWWQTVQAIKVLILESSAVEMTQEERWKFAGLSLGLMRLGTTITLFLF